MRAQGHMHVTPGPEYLAEFESLLEFLRNSRAFDFAAYKRTTLMRRVQRRMQMVGIEGFAAYHDYLEAHPGEVSHLFNMILINVTAFFRDEPVWSYLREHVVPSLLSQRPSNEMIRVWSAGCASGEEPCSLAMLFADAMGINQFAERVKIYATDVDEEALATARGATYTERDVQCLSPAHIDKYFEKSNGRFAFRRDLRRSVIFGRHDLLQDAPISRVNLLSCRNTLMYLNAEAQARVLDRFEFALVPDGYLVMGKAEMLLGRSAGIAPVDLKRRVFNKLKDGRRERTSAVLWAGTRNGFARGSDMRLQELAVESDPVAQLIVDTDRIVVMVNERARSLFGIAWADIGRPIQDLEISYRPVELRSLLDRALEERRELRVKDTEWTTAAGETFVLDITIVPLVQNEQLLGVKVIFRDVTHYRQLQEDLKRSHQELETAYEELQSTNEELETTNEELQSTVRRAGNDQRGAPIDQRRAGNDE